MIPPTACHLARKLGVESVAFDVNGACAGFAYGLATARALMTDMGHRRAILCCTEKYTGFTDYTDRTSCVLFGDSAGSNIWDALALVLIGGLLSSTLFVLTITPAAYHVLERGKARRAATARAESDVAVASA